MKPKYTKLSLQLQQTELEKYEAWKGSGFTMKEFDKAQKSNLIPGIFIGLGLIALAAFCQYILKVVS